MGWRYREHAPSERLRPFVECFWSIESTGARPDQLVLPDGCVDIVCSAGAPPLVVGAMTRARTFAAGGLQVGVRFRPGFAGGFVRAPGIHTVDRLIPLNEVWGTRGRELAEAESAAQCIALLEAELVDASEPGVVQKVSAYIVAQSGQVRVDDLAFDAGMSARQLRRLFLEEVGLTPKHFCRVIRFRHSLGQLRESQRGDWTDVALQSGYYDQAHFIHEFREFTGYTPGEYNALPR